MNILDQDHISAKQYIDYAFLQLLEAQSFKEISVKDIVRKAGISRSTFYLHYQDKYDLLDKVREQLTDTFLSYYDVPDQDINEDISSRTVLGLCQHIYDNGNFYQYELEDPIMVQSLSNRLSAKLLQVYPEQAYAIFASYGTIGYLTYWVKANFPISPYEAANQLLEIGLTDWTTYITKYKAKVLDALEQ